MKVAIMQPYFFPYIGYFSLIKHTQKFIILDDVQFIRHGWIERNRVLKEATGWMYIQVPIIRTHGRNTYIKDIQIDNAKPWKEKILSQLKHYKKTASFYQETITLIRNIFDFEYQTIVDLNKKSLELVCNYLNFNPDIEVFSKMQIKIEQPKSPDEWALNICKAFDNVTEYWNAPNGLPFFDKNKFDEANIRLCFLKNNLPEYNQRKTTFENALSIIDVLLFNSKEQVVEMLNDYEIL